MTEFTRRSFIRLAGGAAAMGAAGFPQLSLGAAKKVVVVGGGIGGATAAKYLKRADPSIDVTVIEPKKAYHTCFRSNLVIGGIDPMDAIRFGYDGLAGHDIKVVHDKVTSIDADGRKVKTAGGDTFSYDRCIVAPGIDFRWDTIEGYDAQVAEKIPHAWQAGSQTKLLRSQLEAMKDGGTVIIAPPPNPFRCPPGPYERASLIANYLQKNKPKSKILILDPKDKFSKFGLFTDGWKRHYGYETDNSLIEWVSGAQGGRVTGIMPDKMTLRAEVENYKGDVINLIPAQKAGKVAADNGLTDETGWCPVDHRTYESQMVPNIHVIGDASIASPLPKSGYAANSEAKVCAAAVAALLSGGSAPEPSWVNTCYSIIAPGDAISVAMVYRLGDDGKTKKVKGSGGLTPMDASAEMRERTEAYAYSWYNNITHDVFG